MKGALRKVDKKSSSKNTNFNDWCDPRIKVSKKRQSIGIYTKKLTKAEERARLMLLTRKTAYSQTVDELEYIRQGVKLGDPLLSQKEIRHLRLQFFNALVSNLRDDGFLATSEYIKDLIILDDMYSRQDPSRVLLKANKDLLTKLSEGLKVAEEAKRRGNRTAEVSALLDLARFFLGSEKWWYWIAQEFLEQCVDLFNDEEYPVEPKVESVVRYVYSSYLLDVLRDLKKAKSQLQLSMNISVGKNFWFVDKGDDKRDENLFMKSCVLMSRIILEMAYDQIEYSTDEAISTCRNALYWAKQTSNQPAIATAMLSLVEMYFTVNQLTSILDILLNYINLCKETKLYRELCEGYVLLAKYHEMTGKDDEAARVIEELIEFGKQHRIFDIVAKAHLKLAEFFAMRGGNEPSMKHHASTALKYYIKMKDRGSIEIAKCLFGIAQGQRLFPQYKKYISYSENLESEELRTLFLWKSWRIPFTDFGHKSHEPEIERNINLMHQVNRKREEESVDAREGRKDEIFSFISPTLHLTSSSVSILLSKRKTNISNHL